MIYTENTIKAMKLAYEAHLGQVDKAGVPYIFHPIHLAEQMKDEDTTVVALLHDVVEDTKYTLKDLKDMGFTEKQVDAVSFMTHDKSEPYLNYVKRVKMNPIAKAVKIADLKHNSDITRVKNPTSKDYERLEKKYKPAMKILMED